MTWQTYVGSILCILCIALACRNGTTPTPANAELTPAATPSTTSTPATLRPPPDDSAIPTAPSTSPVASSAPSPSPTSTPPKLKPVIGKPFPEGASEQVVCEAIDSTEPDLWVRFGHIIPMYLPGALYVLEAGQAKENVVEHYIENQYVHPHYTQQASCRDRTLLYLRDLVESSVFNGKPFGRVHLSQELERRFKIKTIESFHIEHDQERRSRYCVRDADLCERLVKLDRMNEGKGLCVKAVGFAGVSWFEPEYKRALAACMELSPAQVVCAYYGFGPPFTRETAEAQRACSSRITAALNL